MRILSGRTPVRSSGRNPCAIRIYVYTVKNPPRTFRVGDYVELELARKMSAKIQILVLLSSFCCQDGRVVVIYGFYTGNSVQKETFVWEPKSSLHCLYNLCGRRRRGKVRCPISQSNHLNCCRTNSFRNRISCTIVSCLSLDSLYTLMSPLNAHDILHAQKFASRGTLIRGPFDLS